MAKYRSHIIEFKRQIAQEFLTGPSRSAYYGAPAMALDDTSIVEAMSAIRDEFEHYGWRRVQAWVCCG